jgi:hypothetical protein
MELILYLPGKNEASANLLRIIQTVIPDHEIKIYSSIGELSERLHKSMLDVGAGVFHVESRAELLEIIYLKDLFQEMKMILVAPDSQPDTLDKAYTLCPRFIAVAESDFIHLGSVLKKIMDLHGKINEL